MLNRHQKEIIARLYEEGMSPEQIADEFADEGNLRQEVLDYIQNEID